MSFCWFCGWVYNGCLVPTQNSIALQASWFQTIILMTRVFKLHLTTIRHWYMLCFRPYLWGEKAIEHHTLRKSMGDTLLKQPTMAQVLAILQSEKIAKTILNFPLRRKLQVNIGYVLKFVSHSRHCLPDQQVQLWLAHWLVDYNSTAVWRTISTLIAMNWNVFGLVLFEFVRSHCCIALIIQKYLVLMSLALLSLIILIVIVLWSRTSQN